MSDFDEISAQLANICIGVNSLLLPEKSKAEQRIQGIRGLSSIGIEMKNSNDANKLMFQIVQLRIALAMRNMANTANVDKNRLLSILSSDNPDITQADLIQSDRIPVDSDSLKKMARNLVSILSIKKEENSIKQFFIVIFDEALQVFREDFTIDDDHKLELLLAMRKRLPKH